MARVLGMLGNARVDGYTTKVLAGMLEGARSVPGVEAEQVPLLRYDFGPCTSCYECIRMPEHRCILRDDMGQRGEGRLWREIEGANGMILAAPVHCWTADALTHLFVERLYPFLWSGELRGIPVATLAVASNQGFQIVANTMLCEWSFTLGAHYVGGLPVHVAYLEEALPEARHLGVKIGEAALCDEREGRASPSDEELWLEYLDTPWRVYPHYVENLTRGTGDPALSLIRRALAQGSFRRPEAVELLKRADREFESFVHHRNLQDRENALRALVRASSFWTHATWKEYLEEQLVRVPPPVAYRPIEGESGDDCP